jgi:WASH complex subunit 7, N-terminal
MASATDRLLLESFTRPESLIDYVESKIIDFEFEHRDRLAAIESAINPSTLPVGDSASDLIVLTCHPADRVEYVDLVNTSEPDFNKIVLVLGTLVDEAMFLKDQAEAKFYSFLSLFGHSKDDDEAEYAEGVLEAMMGKCLPRFQDCSNLCERITAVATNILQQLAAIHSRGSQFAAAWGEVRLRAVWLALGDLFTVLTTIDAIVRGNKMVS